MKILGHQEVNIEGETKGKTLHEYDILVVPLVFYSGWHQTILITAMKILGHQEVNIEGETKGKTLHEYDILVVLKTYSNI